MNPLLRIYIWLLLVLILGWAWHWISGVNLTKDISLLGFLSIIFLYFVSHLLRLARLAILTLDQREKIFSLISAHTLTAFPSSFLPFKLGELLRLVAFFWVYETKTKAWAVWLAERFGDVLVISIFILGFYILNIHVPTAMRTILILFVLASTLGVLGLFAIAKVFIYLNRHLVLTSLTHRSLFILRISHILRSLELQIYKSLEGRVSAFILLSVLIWSFEISALSLFINQLPINDLTFAHHFSSGLLASLPNSSSNALGVYQSITLVALTLVFLLVILLVNRFKILR
jgi:hypothetical protein